MDKKFYRSILLMVNQKDTFEMLQSYADARIAILREQLETTKEIGSIREIQGMIGELKRFKTLREQVIKGAE
jgi:sensor domain CHASE-containing protein